MKLKTVTIEPKINEIGYEMISDELWEWVFQGEDRPAIGLRQRADIKAKLQQFECQLPPPVGEKPPFKMELPEYSGDLIEFVNGIASQNFQGTLDRIESLVYGELPAKPLKCVVSAGWTRYQPGESPCRVDSPLEGEMVMDVETFYQVDNGVVMAAAVTLEAWYVWLHPSVVNPELEYFPTTVPIGNGKIVVNHNPKFDSARVTETYTAGNGNLYLDTQSMHISICGMSSQQRKVYKSWIAGKASYANKWAINTSANNLIDVYNLHCMPLVKLTADDKTTRNIFMTATSCRQFNYLIGELLDYNLRDVELTHELASFLLPKYRRSQPSLISFAGHLLLNKSFLPVPDEWDNQLLEAEKLYQSRQKSLKSLFNEIAKQLVNCFCDGTLLWSTIQDDPWLSQLDWTPAKTGPTKGQPFWWRKVKNKGITSKSNLAPILLKVSWDGKPLTKHLKHGWIYKDDQGLTVELPNGIPGVSARSKFFPPGTYCRVPHKKGDNNNTGNPLSKDYLALFDKGILTAQSEGARDVLVTAKSISYWESIRKRCFSYSAKPFGIDGKILGKMIEPCLLVAGAATRRCVESLWLTVSGAKKEVVGSEIKGLVRAPKGYKLVGADFDTQELKIASGMADAYREQVFGSTPMGYIQLVGDKAKKTDGHSLLAASTELDRDTAKSLNFQMLYLSGLLGCTMTIKANRPDLTEAQCKAKADLSLKLRRGVKKYKHPSGDQYGGGTDSDCYNMILKLAGAERLPPHLAHLNPKGGIKVPSTPMLGANMSAAILESCCGSDYLTSRANWGIQSSGVDLLHTLLVLMDWLTKELKLNSHFVFSYHDEVWFLVKEGEEKDLAWCLQVSHLMAWGYFFQRLGFKDLPYNYQFYSGVNIDTVFRKEVFHSQTTPSYNGDHIENGVCLQAHDLAVA